MSEQVCSVHENEKNMVTTGVHLISRSHINKGFYKKISRMFDKYIKLHPSRAIEIQKAFDEHNTDKIMFLIFAISHDLGIPEPKAASEYFYYAHSYRRNGKARQSVKYVGATHGKLSMKDLVWLMTGATNFKEVEQWKEQSYFHKWPPLHNVPRLNLRNAILYLLSKIGFAPCASDYIIQHGYPATFKQLFDEHQLTELLTKEAIEHAQARVTGRAFENNNYYSGTPAEAERVTQFLLEHNAMPTCQMKGDLT